MLDQEVSMLRNIELFADLDQSKLKLLAFTSKLFGFEPGEILYKQNEIGNSAYLIIEGSVEILVKVNGATMLVATRGKNDLIGEMSILCDKPRSATVKASEAVSALKISKDVFFQLLSGSPDMAIKIIRVIAERLDSTSFELSDAKAKLAEHHQ